MRNRGKFRRFLDERLGWERIFGHLSPEHANKFPYVLGGTVFVLGIVQGVTGLILQQFYSPEPSSAYESVLAMMSRPDLAFVRSLHYWIAQALILLVILHMTRVFISASFKKPREVQWLVGVVLLILTFSFAYSGTILKWDQEAVEALAHNTEVAQSLGPLGYPLLQEFAPNIPILTRLLAIHATVLPAMILLVFGLHFILIRILGISSPKVKNEKGELTIPSEKMVPFSSHVKRMIIYGLSLTVVMAIVALILPAPLSMKGIEGIEVSKPPWYFLWFFPIEDSFGINALPYVMGLIIAALILVPLVDRKEDTDPRKRKLVMIALFAIVAIIVALMILGSIAPVVKHI